MQLERQMTYENFIIITDDYRINQKLQWWNEKKLDGLLPFFKIRLNTPKVYQLQDFNLIIIIQKEIDDSIYYRFECKENHRSYDSESPPYIIHLSEEDIGPFENLIKIINDAQKYLRRNLIYKPHNGWYGRGGRINRYF